MQKIKDGKVVKDNFFAMVDGKMQKLPIGTPYPVVKESAEKAGEKLVVATPPKDDKKDREQVLREFIYEQTGKRPGGRTSIDKLEETAAELGFGSEE